MTKKNTIRQQFNLQAEKFSNWEITQNIENMKQYSEFCGISEDDKLLDVACGTGDYAIYCAQIIKQAYGVDLSNKMIEIARKNANKLQVNNLSFKVQDVIELPFETDQFSIVNCKSAFHHFEDYGKNINEMRRCCILGGRIAIQDIVAHENRIINDYFERMENLIDISHNKTLSVDFIKKLFTDNNIKILRTHVVNVELSLNEYIHHAVQTKKIGKEIVDLIDYGISAPDISNYFTKQEGEWYLKRNVLLILGEKI